MARVFNGRVPETWITKEKLNLKSRLSLDPLLDSGSIWFEDENGVRLSHSHTRDARSGVSESKTLVSLNTRGESEGRVPSEEDFEALWKAFPSRVGRKPALKRFRATVKTQEDLAAIQRALENYKASERVQRGVVQNGSTWFNQWEDWKESPTSPAATAEPQTWFALNSQKVRDFAFLHGTGDEFTREFGFTKDQWNDYIQALKFDASLESISVGEWLGKRKTA